jgi:hypothetical protein
VGGLLKLIGGHMQGFQEYPKWLPIGDGVIVWNKEEENALQEQEAAEEVKPKRGRKPKNGNQ